MAGIVYLKTNRFEVTLEGITFRTKDFESLCTLDFLFAQGKTWAHKPIVGFDIIHHPRNPKIILLLLCIGTGCVILRFNSGKALPEPILKFLRDERINFVGFGIQEKGDVFPLKEWGLGKKKIDVGYLAAKRSNDPKYKRYKLGELARKILGIKNMVGLTDASSFERHEHIKCAICQLFITTVIGMTLLGSSEDKKKLEDVPKKMSSLLVEELFNHKRNKPNPKKLSKDDDRNENVRRRKEIVDDPLQLKHKGGLFDDLDQGKWVESKRSSNQSDQYENPKINRIIVDLSQPNYKGGLFDYLDNGKGLESKRYSNAGDQNGNSLINKIVDDSLQSNYKDGFFDDLDPGKGFESKRHSDSFFGKRYEKDSCDDSDKDTPCIKTPLKGILKCPSTNTCKLLLPSPSSSSSPASDKTNTSNIYLKRANSKGRNVSFACT